MARIWGNGKPEGIPTSLAAAQPNLHPGPNFPSEVTSHRVDTLLASLSERRLIGADALPPQESCD